MVNSAELRNSHHRKNNYKSKTPELKEILS